MQKSDFGWCYLIHLNYIILLMKGDECHVVMLSQWCFIGVDRAGQIYSDVQLVASKNHFVFETCNNFLGSELKWKKKQNILFHFSPTAMKQVTRTLGLSLVGPGSLLGPGTLVDIFCKMETSSSVNDRECIKPIIINALVFSTYSLRAVFTRTNCAVAIFNYKHVCVCFTS